MVSCPWTVSEQRSALSPPMGGLLALLAGTDSILGHFAQSTGLRPMKRPAVQGMRSSTVGKRGRLAQTGTLASTSGSIPVFQPCLCLMCSFVRERVLVSWNRDKRVC